MTPLDQLIIAFDKGLRTVFAPAHGARPTPGGTLEEARLPAEERQTVARLMRVNHSGEVCAQALYQGQALTARNRQAQQALEQASREEVDHLAWCEQRLDELGGRKSLLNPLWYGASFALGACSGLLGDRWNLGFLAETERQVEGHLSGHLARLPAADRKSRAVLEQMKLDELQHAQSALEHGAAALPPAVKFAMKLTSKVMTQAAYWV